MTSEEITERLIEIAELASPVEQDQALNELKTETGATKRALEAQLKKIVKMAKVAKEKEEEEEKRLALAAEAKAKGLFILLNGNKVRIGQLLDDDEDMPLRLMSVSDAGTWFATWQDHETGDGLFGSWLGSFDRAEFTGFVMKPGEDRFLGGKLNLWRGFGVEPKVGDASPYADYVRAVFGPGANYLLDWAALKVQNPTRLMGVAPVLVSEEEGTGKTTFLRILSTIFGSHAALLQSSDQLTGRFNAELAGALFVQCDEVMFAGDKKGADRAKSIITDPTISIEYKGIDRIKMENMVGVGLTTNHHHAIHIGYSDRRYAMIEARTKYKGKTTYWTRLNRWLDQGGFGIVLHYLQNRDVSKFDIHDRPMSDIYLENRESSLTGPLQWWRACIDQRKVLSGEGVFAGLGYEIDGEKGYHKKETIYGAYVDWHDGPRRPGEPVIDKVFWKAMKRVGVPSEAYKPHGEERKVKLPDWDEAERLMKAFLRG